jgi:hypothetical protein
LISPFFGDARQGALKPSALPCEMSLSESYALHFDAILMGLAKMSAAVFSAFAYLCSLKPRSAFN